MSQREIQILFDAQENTVQADSGGIPCRQVLQTCLMQHALNRRVHRRARARVQQFDPVCSVRVRLTPAEDPVCGFNPDGVTSV